MKLFYILSIYRYTLERLEPNSWRHIGSLDNRFVYIYRYLYPGAFGHAKIGFHRTQISLMAAASELAPGRRRMCLRSQSSTTTPVTSESNVEFVFCDGLNTAESKPLPSKSHTLPLLRWCTYRTLARKACAPTNHITSDEQ